MEIEENNITINQRVLVLYQAWVTKPNTIAKKLDSICKISER